MDGRRDLLLASQRHAAILNEVEAHGTVASRRLRDLLGASVSTIRRDLDELERLGLVRRTRGGVTNIAIPTKTALDVSERNGPPVASAKGTRAADNLDESVSAIVDAAFSRVHAAGSLILDSGVLSRALAHRISASGASLTVITNDLQVCHALTQASSVTLVMLGGVRRQGTAACFGEPGRSFLLNLKADFAFLEGDYPSGGALGELDPVAADWKRLIIDSARQRFLLARSTRFGESGLFRIADLNAFDEVISDSGLAELDRAALVRRGVQLRTVP